MRGARRVAGGADVADAARGVGRGVGDGGRRARAGGAGKLKLLKKLLRRNRKSLWDEAVKASAQRCTFEMELRGDSHLVEMRKGEDGVYTHNHAGRRT